MKFVKGRNYDRVENGSWASESAYEVRTLHFVAISLDSAHTVLATCYNQFESYLVEEIWVSAIFCCTFDPDTMETDHIGPYVQCISTYL